MNIDNRTNLQFAHKVDIAFRFLEEMGFIQVEATSTLVRYRKNSLEVDVYHGRQSYEVSAGITAFGVRYSMSEFIRMADAAAGQTYRSTAATTPEGVSKAVVELSSLMSNYCADALRGDREYFNKLAKQREIWSKDYALDVLAEQVRPRAAEAFRRGDYAAASELYARIMGCLTPAEVKKLAVARSRGRS